nr:DoxX family protein [Bacillus sp. UNC41MFS5]
MTILGWVLQGLLAAMFLMAGFGKVTGSKMHREAFVHWRLPQWFRIVLG